MTAVLQAGPEDWKFLSEGGANLLFAYRDDSHPFYGGKVLRVPKAAPTTADAVDRADAQSAFVAQVLPQLLPGSSLPERTGVRLSAQWIASLMAQERFFRSEVRRDADCAEQANGPESVEGTLMANLLGGEEVLAVEIKPKWGFLPSRSHLSSESLSVKTTHCRYCMHRRLRSSESNTVLAPPDKADYCPLDLYSGILERVGKAVQQLWELWEETGGETNNLRFFLNGKRVDPREQSSLRSQAGPRDHIEHALAECLIKSPVLLTLSNLQHTLDPFDIEGLAERYLAERGTTVFSESEISKPELLAFLNTYKSASAPSSWTLRESTIAYALSATFKDCSIILRLPLRPDGVSAEGARVSVIDLDLKPMGKLGKWRETDEDVWRGFIKGGWAQRDRVCVE